MHPAGRDKRFPIACIRLAFFPLFQALPGAICVAMYIDTVPNRNSPPAILLRESYREQGKVKK
ncbi:MAG: hypothetical protein MUC77_22000, partial [Chromatiaceae bacterium]|nr:hypothetical protein [Chromatiaceae bacterium]